MACSKYDELLRRLKPNQHISRNHMGGYVICENLTSEEADKCTRNGFIFIVMIGLIIIYLIIKSI